MQVRDARQGQPDLWDRVRGSIIGGNAFLDTPFGRRRLTYADHTASGRGVAIIEDQLRSALEMYGNTHTEDDATGTLTSERLRQAEATIKRMVNAGPRHKIVTVGSGTTAAVHQLQQILGIYLPPAGPRLLRGPGRGQPSGSVRRPVRAPLQRGVVEGVLRRGRRDRAHRGAGSSTWATSLEGFRLPLVRGRRKIGAFSAASNVSGVTTPVYDVARILHENGALAFFDFAAAAPYVQMDMRRDVQSSFDALYFSPHKFLGGPGSCGVLIFDEAIYRADLPPTIGAGGTVDFVGFEGQAYSTDIEVREKPGTPGILQTLRAALAMELKEILGPERIADHEAELARRAHAVLQGHPGIDLMGGVGPENRLPIFSFNIRVGSSWLHPRYVTTLLNDLFGIQSRAGCSCAAPYGHRILHIDERKSRELRRSIMCGNVGLKPGWTRVNFHFLHTDDEVDFICRSILFVADHGRNSAPTSKASAPANTTQRQPPARVKAVDAPRSLDGAALSPVNLPGLESACPKSPAAKPRTSRVDASNDSRSLPAS